VKKNFGFFETMVCPHGQGEESADIFQTKGKSGRESIFRDFVRTSLMDSPLSVFVFERDVVNLIIHLFCIVLR